MLAPHGHARLGRLNESDDASYLARGLTLARIGCTAFMWDMVDYNDSARHLSGAYQDEDYGAVHRAFWQCADGEQQQQFHVLFSARSDGVGSRFGDRLRGSGSPRHSCAVLDDSDADSTKNCSDWRAWFGFLRRPLRNASTGVYCEAKTAT